MGGWGRRERRNETLLLLLLLDPRHHPLLAPYPWRPTSSMIFDIFSYFAPRTHVSSSWPSSPMVTLPPPMALGRSETSRTDASSSTSRRSVPLSTMRKLNS